MNRKMSMWNEKIINSLKNKTKFINWSILSFSKYLWNPKIPIINWNHNIESIEKRSFSGCSNFQLKWNSSTILPDFWGYNRSPLSYISIHVILNQLKNHLFLIIVHLFQLIFENLYFGYWSGWSISFYDSIHVFIFWSDFLVLSANFVQPMVCFNINMSLIIAFKEILLSLFNDTLFQLEIISILHSKIGFDIETLWGKTAIFENNEKDLFQ